MKARCNHIYSRAINQPYPRLCLNCREPEPPAFAFHAEPTVREKRSGNIIGLVGTAGAGKDTFFRALDLVGVACHRFAFADALKLEVADLLNVSVNTIEADKPRYRGLLQWWGTEWRRGGWGEEYWLDRLAEQIDGYDPKRLAVITDVRFENEVEFVRSRGGNIIRIHRVETGGDGLTHAAIAHASEQTLRGYTADLTVTNPGDDFGAFLPVVAAVAKALDFPRR